MHLDFITRQHPQVGVTGHPHNGGDPKKLPVISGGVEKVLGGATPPGVIPPIMGGESNDMRGSPRGSQNLGISSGSPPEWGGVLGGVYFRTGSIQIGQKFSSRVARKKTEIFLFTLRN